MADLTRIDPALDILAPHSFECVACGKAILDRQQWLTLRITGLPEGRVHAPCVDTREKLAKAATEWRNRITDQLARPRFGSRPRISH